MGKILEAKQYDVLGMGCRDHGEKMIGLRYAGFGDYPNLSNRCAQGRPQCENIQPLPTIQR